MGLEWGSTYDANLDLARRAVTEVGGDDLKEALEVSGMGNDPALIRAFAGIGRRLYGGGTTNAEMPTATTAAQNSNVLPMPTSPSGGQREILRLRTDEKFMLAYADSTHPSHEIALAEMDALYAAAYPPVRS